MESVWRLSGGCLEDVLEVSDCSVSDPGYYQGCKNVNICEKVPFLSCYKTIVFFPVPSTLPKVFNSRVSARCLEGVWVTLDNVWEVLMPNQLIKFQ